MRKSILLVALCATAIAFVGTVQIRAQSEPDTVLIEKARTLESKGRIDLAVMVWQQVLLADPNDPEALSGMVRYAQRAGDAAAAQSYQDRLKKLPLSEQARAPQLPAPLSSQQLSRLQQAGRLAAAHHPDQAMVLYKEVFADHPPEGDWAIAYYETLYASPGGSDTALARLRELATKHPGTPSYALSLGTLLTYSPRTRAEGVRLLASLQGDAASQKAALAAWRQALLWEKGNPAYEASLKEFLTRQPDPQLETDFGPVQHPRSPQELQRGREEAAAYQELKNGNVAQAQALFEQLRDASPNDPQVLAGLGFVRMKLEDFAAAADLFQQAKSGSPKPDKTVDDALQTALFWKNMSEATASLAQSQPDDALKGFEQALAIHPENPDALAGVAGTLMLDQLFAKAVPVYRKWTQTQSANLKAWTGLLQSLQRSGDASGAISAAKAMPAALRTQCLTDPACIVPIAAADGTLGNASESSRLIEQAAQLALKDTTPRGTQEEVASLLLQSGYAQQATPIYLDLLKKDRTDVDSWRGLVGALHQSSQESQALQVLQRMPRDIFDQAAQNSDFLLLAAAIAQSDGQLDQAHTYLEQAIRKETAGGRSPSLAVRLQVAGLWLQEESFDKAAALYGQIAVENPDSFEAFRGQLEALHGAHHDDEVLHLASSAPSAQRERLESDPDSLSLLAMARSAQGDLQGAVLMLRQAEMRYQRANRPVPAGMQIQFCWALFNSADDANLSAQLQSLSARSDLTDSERRDLSGVWIAWSQKQADSAMRVGNSARALAILTAAQQAFPGDNRLRAAYAGMLLRAGDAEKAFDQYLAWGLRGATADDYQGAIGAAVAVRDYKTADAWLGAAFHRWPQDPQLLMAAARLAVACGDYGRANRYYQQAMASLPAEPATSASPLGAQPVAENATRAQLNLAQLVAPAAPASGPATGRSPTPTSDALDDLLNGPTSPSSGIMNFPALSAAPQSLSNVAAPQPSQKQSVQPTNSDLLMLLSNNPSRQDSPKPPPSAKKSKPAPKPESPSRTNGSADSLSCLLQQNDCLPASADRSFLYSESDFGPPSGTLAAFAMTQPQGSAGPSPLETASAAPLAQTQDYSSQVPIPPAPVAAAPANSPRAEIESEIASMSNQLSPYVAVTGAVVNRSGQSGFDQTVTQQGNFEASTVVGGSARVTVIGEPIFMNSGSPSSQTTLQLGTLPLGSSFGPISATGIGGELQMTTQNYAFRFGTTPLGFSVANWIGTVQLRPSNGPFQIRVSRDPIRETILSYAGIRDPGSGQIWGGVIANSVTGSVTHGSASSGLYAQLGYQEITGRDVATNHQFNGNAGSYWQVLSLPLGTLTMGINLTAMHYDLNLRYFTFGQGGYFSPQSYILFNFPIHWSGVYRDRFAYSVDGSLGPQTFKENASPYFPLSSAQTTFYPGQVSSSANYSVDVRTMYRFEGNWVLGGFLDFNNTLNYVSRTAGIFVRFQKAPFPAEGHLTPTTLPDWQAIRPLLLP